MEIKYLNQDEFNIEVGHFSSYLEKLSDSINLMDGILNIVFVNNQYIQSLNKAYRSKDVPTDVLSFFYGEDDLLGEIYISAEKAKSQSIEYKHSLSDELIRLIVHGTLHIHGYDHENDEDYKKMLALEKKILGEIV